jgi:ribonuclease HI
MNNIQTYVDGKTFGKNGSGFAVILISKTNKWKRSFAYGNFTGNHVSLLAVKFAILSVAEFYRKNKIDIFIKNKYVRDMFEKDDNGNWSKLPRKNEDLITEIRNLMTSNINLQKPDDNDENISECTKLVEDAVKNDLQVDIRN